LTGRTVALLANLEENNLGARRKRQAIAERSKLGKRSNMPSDCKSNERKGRASAAEDHSTSSALTITVDFNYQNFQRQ
jgi:hypothetical protein